MTHRCVLCHVGGASCSSAASMVSSMNYNNFYTETSNLIDDVKTVYHKELDEALEEYNKKQT